MHPSALPEQEAQFQPFLCGPICWMESDEKIVWGFWVSMTLQPYLEGECRVFPISLTFTKCTHIKYPLCSIWATLVDPCKVVQTNRIRSFLSLFIPGYMEDLHVAGDPPSFLLKCPCKILPTSSWSAAVSLISCSNLPVMVSSKIHAYGDQWSIILKHKYWQSQRN